MNKVCLCGRLTKNPELKANSNGKSYCRFTLAVDRYNGEEKTADFINCVTWNKSAENLKLYMKKGSRISVVGNIRTSSYEDENGNKKYIVEVQCEHIEYLETKKDSRPEPEEPYEDPTQIQDNDPFANFGAEVEIDDNYLD